jgi:hypothetical protein
MHACSWSSRMAAPAAPDGGEGPGGDLDGRGLLRPPRHGLESGLPGGVGAQQICSDSTGDESGGRTGSIEVNGVTCDFVCSGCERRITARESLLIDGCNRLHTGFVLRCHSNTHIRTVKPVRELQMISTSTSLQIPISNLWKRHSNISLTASLPPAFHALSASRQPSILPPITAKTELHNARLPDLSIQQHWWFSGKIGRCHPRIFRSMMSASPGFDSRPMHFCINSVIVNHSDGQIFVLLERNSSQMLVGTWADLKPAYSRIKPL